MRSPVIPSPGLGVRRVAATVAAACVIVAAPTPAVAAQGSPVEIDGVDDRNVRAALRDVLPERPKPETLFDAERIADEAAARARDWLRSEGYYAGDAAPAASDQPPRARIVVTLGRRFVFAAPALMLGGGAAPEDVQIAKDALARHVATGRPARAEDVLAAEQALLAALRARGYAGAQLGTRDAIVDHATGDMRLTFRADAGGAPARLGAITVEPPGALRPEMLAKLPSWKPGATYSPEALAGLRRALTSTGAFSRVDVAVADPAPGAAADAPRDVTVRLERTRPRTVELGASWSSTEGAGLDAEWSYHNALRRAETFSAGLRLADREQRLTTSLYLPHAAGLGRARRFSAEIVREQARPYDRIGASVSAAVEAQRTVRDALTYGVSLSVDAYDAAAGVDSAVIFSGFGNWRRDTTDDRFDARRGAVIEARVEPSVSTGSATVPFVRSTADVRLYRTPRAADGEDGRFTYAARLRGGWVQPITGDASDLPLDRRFYAGGGGSVRGYAFQSIYPRGVVASASPPGGQGLFETSVEARARITRSWGVAGFVDGGSAFDDASGLGDLRWGAGLGLRYDLGFGPLRLDVAAPLDRRASDSAVAVYVSFGQAF
ncbi:MAG: BamA/TamA family outer membrane protein [Alphaproteobacteria bacterium]|nr:BamA/TamA family outer membrane protein [Alphaproteobacteria bacterium]